MSAQPDRFAALFDHPTVEAMHALSSRDFERFVAYVLRRAGYDVTEVGLNFLRGIDLELRLPGKKQIVGGVECKRYAPHRLVRVPTVRGARGAAAVSRPGAKPFVITTSDFVGDAHKEAHAAPKTVHLINGAQLVRYIAYVQGSRYDDENTITTLSPEYFAGRRKSAPERNGATILTVANNKGGVGKTITSFYLGGELARQGYRVLLIDLDGQANLTEMCFAEPAENESSDLERFPNIADYFTGRSHLSELVTSTGRERLAIIPADRLLRLRDLGGGGRPDIESTFAREVRELALQPLAPLGGAPDWIIIDTPPAMSVFTRAGLATADYVLAPVRPRRASIAGTTNMLETLRTMNALTENSTTFLGAVITHWDGLVLSQRVVDLDLRVTLDRFGGYALVTKIPFDNQLETYEPGAKIKGARAYEELAQEVVQHVNVSRNATIHDTIQASQANVAQSAKDVGNTTTLEHT